MILPIIKKYYKLLISIMLVSAMGCGSMTGLSAAYVSLGGSLYDYVDEYCYPDAMIITDVTSRSITDKLESLQSVDEVDARLFLDTYIKNAEGRYLSVRTFMYNPDDREKFKVWSQTESGSSDGICLEYNFAEDNGINVGDTISTKINNKYRDFVVSGIVTCPETIQIQPTDNSFGVNTDFGYAYAPIKLLADEYQKKYDSMKSSFEKRKADLDSDWEKLQKEFEAEEKQLVEEKKNLSTDDKKASEEIAAKEEDLARRKSDALTEYNEMNEDISSSLQKLEESESYDQMCNQLLVYFKDGSDKSAELQKLRDILEQEEVEIKSSYTNEESAVYKRINDNLKTIETMSVLMPTIFFVIILIVVFLFMSLIIKQSRREIGILRALGFTKGDIRLLFCGVDLAASLVSILLGLLIGYFLMRYVGDYYADFFPLPFIRFRYDWVMFGFAAVLTIAAGQLSTLISTNSMSRIHPSEAMSRPVPENTEIPAFMKKLTANTSPMTKFSIITLFRNKMRFVFSVVCIAASVMMIFSSFAFISSKNCMLNQLYGDRIKYDCQIFFLEEPSADFMEKLGGLGIAEDIQKVPFYQKNIEFDGKSEKAVINCIDPETELIGVFDSRGRKLEVPESGLVIEKHTAELLGADVGDEVAIDGKSFSVSQISDQSVNRFQYMSFDSTTQLGEPLLYSVICNIDEANEQELLSFLIESENYQYVIFTRLAYKGLEKIFRTYDFAAMIIVGFAVTIGLIIVINTAQTNLLEKKRELCVLRTLGFQHSEISRKWFVQSFLQFIFSFVIGLPLGITIAKFGLEKLGNADREYVFANSINEYLFTILIVFAYVVVSHFIAMASMKRWDLVENVKDKE